MSPCIQVNARMSGHFTLTKGKVDSEGLPIPGTEKVVADFDNLITDNGLDSIYDCPAGAFGAEYLFPYCLVGTGSTTPAFTDTTLDAYLAISTRNDSGTASFVDDASFPYWKYVRVYRFNAGTATGNLSEVGTGWATNDLFSRALILDGGGLPTTITVLSDEYLDVTYEFRNYFDAAGGTASITISGTPYDVTYIPATVDTPWTNPLALTSNSSGANTERRLNLYQTQTLGTVYTEPSGSVDTDNSQFSGYTLGNYYADITFDYALGDANFTGGIGAGMLITTFGSFQFSFTPKIPKTSSMVLSITLRFTWARYP